MKTRTLVSDDLTPVRAYALLRKAAGNDASFLLESVVAGERWGRYSILGYRPRYEATLSPDGWTLSDGRKFPRGSDPLTAASTLFGGEPSATKPGSVAEKLARAHVGFFAWDLVQAIEKVEPWEGTRTLARFVGGSTTIVFDNLTQTMTLAAGTDDEIDRAIEDLGQSVKLGKISLPDRSRIPEDVVTNVDDDRFAVMVLRAQEYIAAGDAFQIVLARTFSVARKKTDPFDVYRAMRVINPSPYMYFLDFPALPGEATRTQVLGASPETLVRLEDGVMTVRPLAGTRPRGKTPAEDEALEQELLADPKERAEHVMLIDLGRNDVGRVADIGSVRLNRRMEIERYSHVMHIVSEVEGRVDPMRVAPLEVFRAAFPAGTLSGAPKLRAMQIIRELEPAPRGIYGGAVGYVAEGGDLDFAIAIRTAVCKDETFVVTAGAGIVEASVPSEEATETRNKARGVLCSIEAAR